MNRSLINPEVQKFINEKISVDTATLALSKSPFPDISMKELTVQIEGKRKAKEKLPTFFKTKNIIYPSATSMEQCSSEQTAVYKASLCRGVRVADLTGGFGVDSWAFSQQFDEVFYYELNKDLADIAHYNFNVLDTENIFVRHGDGSDLLKKESVFPDWIYIDPSRRDSHNRRVHAFSDCTPDVTGNLEKLFEYAGNIMVKSSPMFDIEKALSELKYVREVHIVALKNEVREVLYILKKDEKIPVKMATVNILPGASRQEFSFLRDEARGSEAIYSSPLRYLYEPNSAVMKSGAFNLICARYPVSKLHKNSHLYTSGAFVKDFPGRVFEIEEIFPYKRDKRFSKANITVRNFPASPEQVRKKMKLEEGGEFFFFCTTLYNDKPVVLVCKKVS